MVEDEIAQQLAKEIQKEIDEGILSNILLETGWTQIYFEFKNNQHAVDIADWILNNCQCQVERFTNHYLFEDKKDAEWFILRWV